jgi:hypothetical protein
MTESFLQGAEETSGTGKRQGHGAELANEFMPGLGGNAGLVRGNGSQDGMEAVAPMGRKGKGVLNCV